MDIIRDEDIETLKDVLDYLYDLRAEWAWYEKEPRNNYRKTYADLNRTIEKYVSLLNRIEQDIKQK